MTAELARLVDQINWYDDKSRIAQRWFKGLKVLTIVPAAVVPLAAVLVWHPVVVGAIGILIIIAEGIQQLNQYQHNWITYRATCEALKHEKFLFLAKAGPYGSADNPSKLLAERVESLVSQGNGCGSSKWIL
jgi:hypothetical protein